MFTGPDYEDQTHHQQREAQKVSAVGGPASKDKWEQRQNGLG